MKRLLMVLLAVVIALPAVAQTKADNKRDIELAQSLELFFNLFRTTNALYVDTVNPKKMVRTAITSMLEELDPYTEYIPKSEKEDFDFMTTGKYAGIGSLIRQRGEWVEISEPYIGTPADRAGLKAGDRLVEIDGTSLRGLGSAKVSAMLKGEGGTSFTLKYVPLKDTTTTISVKIHRERIVIPAIPYAGMITDSIGYIRFTSFTDDAGEQFKKAFQSLPDPKGLIIDLRNNGGGVIDGAIKIAGLFVPQGTIITTLKGRAATSNSTYRTPNSPLSLDLPIVVLTAKSSASASEILAGAMQDLDRAVIVGQRSFGKGLVQTTRPVSDEDLMKITIARYHTPSGRCIQALDYAHRADDGSVSNIPDSLVKEFKTANNRKVYDGGGINPDVKTTAQYWAKFPAIISAYGYIDDFANLYASKNKPMPLDKIEISNEIYTEFVKFMQDKTISYKSSTQLNLEELRKNAKEEKYLPRIDSLLNLIEQQIKDDKNKELELCKDEIKLALAMSLATRWHYNAGAIELTVKGREDQEVRKAVEILSNPSEYKRILSSQDTTKN